MGIWVSGNLGVWESGNLGVWASGRLGIWVSGHLGNWHLGGGYKIVLRWFSCGSPVVQKVVLRWFSCGSPVVQYGGSPVVLPWFSGGSPMLTIFKGCRSLKNGYVVYVTRIYRYIWYGGCQNTLGRSLKPPTTRTRCKKPASVTH